MHIMLLRYILCFLLMTINGTSSHNKQVLALLNLSHLHLFFVIMNQHVFFCSVHLALETIKGRMHPLVLWMRAKIKSKQGPISPFLLLPKSIQSTLRKSKQRHELLDTKLEDSSLLPLYKWNLVQKRRCASFWVLHAPKQKLITVLVSTF